MRTRFTSLTRRAAAAAPLITAAITALTQDVNAGQTGAVGHRYLDLDQSMIMAALDDVLNHHALQQRWAADQVGQVDARYLRAEQFSVAPEH